MVLFDFDGTLADSFPWFGTVLNDVADRYRFRRIEPHEVDTLRGCDARTIIRTLGVAWWKLPMIAGHLRRLNAEAADRIPLFDGVREMLAELAARGVVLGIVTSNAQANVRTILGSETAGLVSHYACDAPLFGKAKRLRAVLRRTRTAPHEALFVGDELRDREAARRAGIPFGAVAWGYTRPDALLASRPAACFTRMPQIVEAVFPPPR